MKTNDNQQSDTTMKVFLFGLLLASALMFLQALTMCNKAAMALFGVTTIVLLYVNAKNDIRTNHCDDNNDNS